MAEQELTFEQATAKLDEIVRTLERGDAPLDKSLEMFEEGAKLIKICNMMLDEAEQRVTGLQVDSETTKTREIIFDSDE